MAISERMLQDLPEWYRTEKDTQKTLQRLNDLKAIRFYLEHSDPFIRRLAIIRAGEQESREAYTLLSEISEDTLEAPENRDLAAHLMAKLNEDLNLGFFLHSTFSSGHGAADPDGTDLKVLDDLPDMHFNFSGSLIESQLILDQTLQRSHLEDVKGLFAFSLKVWLTQYAKSAFQGLGRNALKLLAGLGRLILGLPKILLGLVGKGLRGLSEKRSAHLAEREKRNLAEQERKQQIEAQDAIPAVLAPAIPAPEIHPVNAASVKPSRPSRSPKAYSIRHRRTGIPLVLKLRDLFRSLFRMACWPLRVLFRFKYVILFTLAVMYAGLSFTIPGKAFLFRINPQFYEANLVFQDHVAHLALSALDGTLFMEPAAARPPVEIPVVQTQAPAEKHLIVTASKGLYLRREPAADGEKIHLMEKGYDVVYQSEKADTEGVVWYQVLMQDGTAGWANAQYLKEAAHE